jgi:cytochrome c-type biogenesis protein CcmE
VTLKLLVASVIILSALGFGAMSFIESNVQYTDFQSALRSGKKVQVKGEWVREKPSAYDAAKNQFRFSLRDEKNTTMTVVYDGPSPNNFELATAVVIKGKIDKDVFHASEILTKCPSKYESAPTTSN